MRATVWSLLYSTPFFRMIKVMNPEGPSIKVCSSGRGIIHCGTRYLGALVVFTCVMVRAASRSVLMLMKSNEVSEWHLESKVGTV